MAGLANQGLSGPFLLFLLWLLPSPGFQSQQPFLPKLCCTQRQKCPLLSAGGKCHGGPSSLVVPALARSGVAPARQHPWWARPRRGVRGRQPRGPAWAPLQWKRRVALLGCASCSPQPEHEGSHPQPRAGSGAASRGPGPCTARARGCWRHSWRCNTRLSSLQALPRDAAAGTAMHRISCHFFPLLYQCPPLLLPCIRALLDSPSHPAEYCRS